MSTAVGVVGPSGLIDGIAAVVAEQPGVTVVPVPFDDENEVPDLVGARGGEVDGWLFSGVVPYTVARDAGVVDRPAAHVEFTGEDLVQALLQTVRAGHDVARLSVDTLTENDVRQTFAESGIPTDALQVLPYRPGMRLEELAEFHRGHHRAGRTAVALTGVSAVHAAVAGELPTVRLVPLAASLRSTLRQLLLSISRQLAEDAQVALGLVELRGDDHALQAEAAALAGTLARTTGGTYLLATTRGPLVADTTGFTWLPMLGRLADRHEVVRVGLGLGDTAAEAETRARHALARARDLRAVSAVLFLRDGTDMVLDVPLFYDTTEVERLPVLANRVGVSVATIRRLQRIGAARGDRPITTRELADELGMQVRSARRLLQRLEFANLVERTGHLSTGATGRPLTLYRLTLRTAEE